MNKLLIKATSNNFTVWFSLFILTLLSHVTIVNQVSLWFVACGAFFWAFRGAGTTAMVAVFVAGLISDGIVGTLFGFHALALITIYKLALSQRQFLLRQPFMVVWFYFSVTIFVVMVAMAGIYWLFDIPVSLWIIVNWLFTSFSFPIIFALLNKWGR